MFYAEAQVGTNTCAGDKRGECQHMCLATSSTTHVCKCAIGFDADPDDSTKCVGKPEFIFYSNHELKGIELYSKEDPAADLEQRKVIYNVKQFLWLFIFFFFANGIIFPHN